MVYSTEDLSLGLHALKITKVSGKYILLDSLAVYGAVAGPDMNCDVADHLHESRQYRQLTEVAELGEDDHV